MKRVLRALGVAIAALIPLAASAQAWPTKPIRIVVPFSAGGTTDLLARAVGQKLSEQLGQPVVVDNRAGAGGNIGADAVAKAAPDGHTLVMGTVGTHAINASLYRRMPYDTVKDFAPVSLVALVPNLLVVHPSMPVKSVKELVAYAKANPGKLNFASPGNGSSPHLSGELFDSVADTQMVHIPYKGSAPAVADLMGGQVQLMFDNMPSALPHVKSGKLRALAVTTAKRSAAAPELPTIAEAGLPGYEATSWFGLLAPAGTPKEIVGRLNAEVVKIVGLADMKEKLLQQGAEAAPTTPEQFAAHIRAEMAKWATVVKRSGAQLD